MMMNEIFQDLITEGIVSVYLDNILIFTNSLEEHHWITCLVLDGMRKHKLYLRLEKCEFEKTRIRYLSVIISHNKVEMDPVQIARVCKGNPNSLDEQLFSQDLVRGNPKSIYKQDWIMYNTCLVRGNPKRTL
jgi:hypothetical protein